VFSDGGVVLDPARNADAFDAVLDVLEAEGAVLLFPEGKSHSDPALAPLKTRLARMALMARAERCLNRILIIPIGLTFERKWEARSRVLMQFGTPIMCVAGVPNEPNDVGALTRRVDACLVTWCRLARSGSLRRVNASVSDLGFPLCRSPSSWRCTSSDLSPIPAGRERSPASARRLGVAAWRSYRVGRIDCCDAELEILRGA